MRNFNLLVILILLNACASIGSLNGGDKDINAPKIIKSNFKETNFKDNKLVITFDEYVQLNNQTENIKLFPNHSSLNCQIVNRSLEISFDSILRKNTTYHLQIKDGIKDNNEGNLYSADFIFSTGNILDTCKTSIKFDNDKKFKQVYVNILNSKYDTINIKQYDYQYNFVENTIEVKGLKENKKYYYYIYTDLDLNKVVDNNTILFEDTFTCKNTVVNSKNYILIDTSIKVKRYNGYKKEYKSIYRPNFNHSDSIVYSTKDSALYGVKMDLNDSLIYKEVKELIKNNITVIKNDKKYTYYFKYNNLPIDSINLKITYKNSNFIVSKEQNKIDTFKFKIDKSEIKISSKEITENNNISEVKFINENLKKYYIIIYKENIIIETFLINEKEFEVPIIAGDYILEIYDVDNNKINKIVSPKIYKKLILKPNWIEEIIL